tara:strand:- start:2772 stop:4535 length:1764 start_codon:yes stop_codon:yes gene_type:complete
MNHNTRIEDLIINDEFDYLNIKNIIKKNMIEDFKYYKKDVFKKYKLKKSLILKMDEIIFRLDFDDFVNFLLFLEKNYIELLDDDFLSICLDKLDDILIGEYHIFKKVGLLDIFKNLFENFNYENQILINFFENFIKKIDNETLLNLFLKIKNLKDCKKISNWHLLEDYVITIEDNEQYILKLMNIISRKQKINFLDIIRRNVYDSNKMLNIIHKLLEDDVLDNSEEVIKKRFYQKKSENKFKKILKKILISFSLNDDLNLDFLNMFTLIDSKFDLINDYDFMSIINISKVVINVSSNVHESFSKKTLKGRTNKKKFIINVYYLIKFIKLLELKVNKKIVIDYDNLKKNIFSHIFDIVTTNNEIYHFKTLKLEEINYNHIFDNKKQILKYILLLNLIIDHTELNQIEYIFTNINEKTRLIFDKIQLIKFIYKNKKKKDNKIFDKIIEYLKSLINQPYKVFFFEKSLITYKNFVDKIYNEFEIYEQIDEIFLEYEDKYKESDLSLFNNVTLTIDSDYVNRFRKNAQCTIDIINRNYEISRSIVKKTKEVLYECKYLDLESLKDIEKRYKYLYTIYEYNYEKDSAIIETI